MTLPELNQLEIWFLTGSQHLYGPEALQRVAEHSQQVVASLDDAEQIAIRIIFKPVLTSEEDVLKTIVAANQEEKCIGIVAWMHTFSPAKMWIRGLRSLQKPLCHLHTQFNREIPWSTIDMDFMNLNQSAHGGREFGFMTARMQIPRKVIVGHWEDNRTRKELGIWARAAAAKHDLQHSKIARLGDNMREVAVTEGDKIAAQETLGVSVNGYGMGEVSQHISAASESEINELCAVYAEEYRVSPELLINGERHESLRDAARIEIGLRSFLTQGGFSGFTDTFENLHDLKQLPGISAQRLMADGYGFGAEGDWKAAALLRAAKVMSYGLPGGTSFMEDYTYHLVEDGEDLVLGAHMLEICPSIAADQPRCEIHPLGIGGKEDPVRLVFDVCAGPAINITLVDMGDRFRMIANELQVVETEHPLEKLPVARALWKPMPDLPTAAAAWIYAGGSHHPTFCQAISIEYWKTSLKW